MAPRPRNRINRDLPLNVYRTRGTFEWRHPVTGQRFGLGSNRQAAEAQAHEANIAVLGLLEKQRLVHRIAGWPGFPLNHAGLRAVSWVSEGTQKRPCADIMNQSVT